jgi:hypothetical protein
MATSEWQAGPMVQMILARRRVEAETIGVASGVLAFNREFLTVKKYHEALER